MGDRLGRTTNLLGLHRWNSGEFKVDLVDVRATVTFISLVTVPSSGDQTASLESDFGFCAQSVPTISIA